MSDPVSLEQQLFVEWFAEQYDCGVPDQDTLRVCRAYLQGMLDRCGPEDNRANLIQCISSLSSAETMVRVLRQYQVKFSG